MDRSAIDVVEHPKSPVLVHVPHSSRSVPDWARDGLLLDDVKLSRELDAMTDAHTDLIAERAHSLAASPANLFINRLSRLVVDPERFPDEREEMLAVGMGAVYTHGHDRRRIRATVQQDLIAMVFKPYAAAFTRAVDRILDVHGRALIIDVHSYPRDPLPYELHADGARPQVCLGTDECHTPHALLRTAREAFGAFEIEVNTPFAGTYVPLQHYGTNPAVSSLMVEIRRDVYLDEELRPVEAGTTALSSALAELIDAVGEPA